MERTKKGTNTGAREVLGRQFNTQAEYDLACKDAEYIEQIKHRYDMESENGLKLLVADLKAGKYRFRTVLGRDFLEELQEELDARRKAAAANAGKKGKKGGKTKGKDAKKASGKKSAAASGKDAKKSGVSLEDYDKDMQKSILRAMKKQERTRRLIITACLSIALCCFVYLGIYTYQIRRLDSYTDVLQNRKGMEGPANVTPETVVIHYDDQEIVIPDILDEYKNLYSLNKRLIGWVKIDDTYIDYPVLQTVNNEYYLNHNFDQQEDKNGSIFMDKDCLVIPRSTNLILYGHHMRSGRMFGQLNRYSSEDFYKKHRYIQFDTIYEKGTYEIMYVFRSRIYGESEIVFKYYQFINAESEAEFDSYMREMEELSLYDTGVTASFGDELLTLSTCDYYTSNGRFVVVAKRIW